MVDHTRVLRLLRGITDDLGVLRAEAAADDVRRADPMWLRGVKYAFVTTIESCVDIAQHICSANGWGPPADNGDAIRLLGDHGVLTTENAQAVRQAVGFRNILVREYVGVRDDVVVERLGDLSDLDEFTRAIAGYLAR